MNLHTQTKGFEITRAIEHYLDKRLRTIRRVLKRVPGKREIWIELSKITQHHHKGNYFEAKIDVALKNKTLHAEERAESLYEAIDKMEARIVRELKHYKDKTIAKDLRQARRWKALTRLSPLIIIRRKGQRRRNETQ